MSPAHHQVACIRVPSAAATALLAGTTSLPVGLGELKQEHVLVSRHADSSWSVSHSRVPAKAHWFLLPPVSPDWHHMGMCGPPSPKRNQGTSGQLPPTLLSHQPCLKRKYVGNMAPVVLSITSQLFTLKRLPSGALLMDYLLVD